MTTLLHRLIGGLGRVLVAVGLLALTFAVFQYWGTGLAEARAQEELDGQFLARLASVQVHNEDPTTGSMSAPPQPPEPVDAPSPVSTAPMVDAATPEIGEAAGRIIIPAIGLDKTFVQGVGRDELRKGPGHYPQTVLPGQRGNAAIAGHRTTYGAPFFDLDKLVPGDEIIVETVQGRFTYTVDDHQFDGRGESLGHFIVDPTATWVLDDRGDSRLTLTACHPKRSAAQRIVVTATLDTAPAPPTPAASLVIEPVPEPSGPGGRADEAVAADDVVDRTRATGEARSLDESLGWQPEHWPATALWGGLSAVAAAAGWLLDRRWRRGPAYAAAAGPFLGCLFMCFTNLDKLLPAI